MRRDIRQLQLERDVLTKTIKLIERNGHRSAALSNQRKAILVNALKQAYASLELLAILGLARSSDFYHRSRPLVPDKQAGEHRVIADSDAPTEHRSIDSPGQSLHCRQPQRVFHGQRWPEQITHADFDASGRRSNDRSSAAGSSATKYLPGLMGRAADAVTVRIDHRTDAPLPQLRHTSRAPAARPIASPGCS